MHIFAHSFSNATGNEMLRAQMDPGMLSKYSAEFADNIRLKLLTGKS